ncbi:MAG: DUF3667 domain-containing protein [Bacteroidaceae bacterium]|nr:DUF3667 domain-containing protein [Bacteroidaceae bacterium]
MKRPKSPSVLIRSYHMREFRRNHKIPESVNTCLNCGNEYLGNFCPACGQSCKVRPVSLINAIGGIPHMITSGDHNIFYTYLELMFRPGHAIRDYIKGHRVRYYSPITLVFILTLIYLLLCYVLDVSELRTALKLPFGLDSVMSLLPGAVVENLKALAERNTVHSALETLNRWLNGNIALHIVAQIPIYAIATLMAYKPAQGMTAQRRVEEQKERLGDEDPDEGYEGDDGSSAFETLVVIPLRPILGPFFRLIAVNWRRFKACIGRGLSAVADKFAVRPDAIIDIAHRTGELYDECEGQVKETLRHHTSPRGKVGIARYNFLEIVYVRAFMAVMFLTINLVALMFGFRFGSMNIAFIVITLITYKQFYSQQWLYSLGKVVRMYIYFATIIIVLTALLFVGALAAAVVG